MRWGSCCGRFLSWVRQLYPQQLSACDPTHCDSLATNLYESRVVRSHLWVAGFLQKTELSYLKVSFHWPKYFTIESPPAQKLRNDYCSLFWLSWVQSPGFQTATQRLYTCALASRACLWASVSPHCDSQPTVLSAARCVYSWHPYLLVFHFLVYHSVCLRPLRCEIECLRWASRLVTWLVDSRTLCAWTWDGFHWSRHPSPISCAYALERLFQLWAPSWGPFLRAYWPLLFWRSDLESSLSSLSSRFC